MSEELATLSAQAFRHSVRASFCSIGHGAALREFCCQRIRGCAAGLQHLPLLFAIPKRNGAGRGDERDKRQCRNIWNAIGFLHIHQ